MKKYHYRKFNPTIRERPSWDNLLPRQKQAMGYVYECYLPLTDTEGITYVGRSQRMEPYWLENYIGSGPKFLTAVKGERDPMQFLKRPVTADRDKLEDLTDTVSKRILYTAHNMSELIFLEMLSIKQIKGLGSIVVNEIPGPSWEATALILKEVGLLKNDYDCQVVYRNLSEDFMRENNITFLKAIDKLGSEGLIK